MSKARGVVVAALEDYGLVPIEANFRGTPTIAYGAYANMFIIAYNRSREVVIT